LAACAVGCELPVGSKASATMIQNATRSKKNMTLPVLFSDARLDVRNAFWRRLRISPHHAR
jgi:hypothetical protein